MTIKSRLADAMLFKYRIEQRTYCRHELELRNSYQWWIGVKKMVVAYYVRPRIGHKTAASLIRARTVV